MCERLKSSVQCLKITEKSMLCCRSEDRYTNTALIQRNPITVVLSHVEFKHDSKCQHFCVLLVWGCYCQNSSSFLVCFLLCFSAPCWTFLIQRPGCSYCPLTVDSSIMIYGHDSFDRLDKPAFSWRLLHCLDTFDKSEGRAGNFDTRTFRIDRWGFNCTATTLCLVTLTLDQPNTGHL